MARTVCRYILSPQQQAACSPPETPLGRRRENDLMVALSFTYDLILKTDTSDESICLMVSHLHDRKDVKVMPGQYENPTLQFVEKIRGFERTLLYELHDLFVKPFRAGHVVMLLDILKMHDSASATPQIIRAICLEDESATAEWAGGLDTGLRRLYYHIRAADGQVRMDGWRLFLPSENSRHIFLRVDDMSSSSNSGDPSISEGGFQDDDDGPPPASVDATDQGGPSEAARR